MYFKLLEKLEVLILNIWTFLSDCISTGRHKNRRKMDKYSLCSHFYFLSLIWDICPHLPPPSTATTNKSRENLLWMYLAVESKSCFECMLWHRIVCRARRKKCSTGSLESVHFYLVMHRIIPIFPGKNLKFYFAFDRVLVRSFVRAQLLHLSRFTLIYEMACREAFSLSDNHT